MQHTLLKIKTYFDEKQCKKLYPTGSRPGLFHGTAKVGKVRKEETFDELTMRPIISNIGTATYETAKYLNSLLAPLGKSECSLLSTETIIKHIKGQRIPDCYQIISFDVKSLFTNVPLDETINIVLRKVYDENKKVTNLPR